MVEDAAVDITKITSEAIDKYYNSLSVLGYRPQSDANKLLVLSFIEELMTGDMSYLINNEDYRIIHRVLNCLYGSCLIPFPQCSGGRIFGVIPNGDIRISEEETEPSNEVRISEDADVRFTV